MRKILFILLLGLCWSCGETENDPWHVSGPRILAIKADPAEQTAGTGQTITLTALAVDPGGILSSEFVWSKCASINRDGCKTPVPLGEKNPLAVSPPVAENLSEALSFSETGVIYQFQINHSTGSEKGIKRVVLNMKSGNNNSNPSILQISQNNTSLTGNAKWVVEKGKEYPIRFTISEPEEYLKTKPDGSTIQVTEEPFISSVTDLGTFDKFRVFYPKLQNTWTAPENEKTGRLYFILRDGRGGIDWVTIPVAAK